MSKIYTSIFVFLFLGILLSSCREGRIEPVRKLEVYVVDTLGVPVENAEIGLYFTEQELNTASNKIMETLYTNQAGIVQVALDAEIFDYYVNIEKNELNNWYTTTFVSVTNIRSTNKVTITIKDCFEAKLTGKYRKRWQQTDDLINGNPSFPSCSNQLYHDFARRPETAKDTRDGEVEKYQTDICPFPGKSEGINQWVYNEQNNTMTFGIDFFAETYQVTEFTNDIMILTSTTPDGLFVKEKRYKFIE